MLALRSTLLDYRCEPALALPINDADVDSDKTGDEVVRKARWHWHGMAGGVKEAAAVEELSDGLSQGVSSDGSDS